MEKCGIAKLAILQLGKIVEGEGKVYPRCRRDAGQKRGGKPPLSLSFDFVFSSEIFKSLSFRLDRLCRLAILCLDQHAHTLHHLESLLTISLDRLDIFEGRSCISEFVRKSLSLILELS
ncbi:hypothetical protein Tco_1369744 [Tanacetum coccineum]